MTTQGVYRHYKGGLYTVLFTARNSTNFFGESPVVFGDGANQDTRTVMVVYFSHEKGTINVRDEKEFNEFVYIEGKMPTRRFERVDP